MPPKRDTQERTAGCRADFGRYQQFNCRNHRKAFEDPDFITWKPGNRCFDLNVPEETNRRIIDHTSDYNLCYTEHARRHLISEGLPHRRIYVTGSPMREVLLTHLERIKSSDAVARLGLEKGKFFLASIHREENVRSPRKSDAVVICYGNLGE